MSHTAKTIRIACPHCGVVLETEDSIAGAQVDCPECGKAFLATPIKPQPASMILNMQPQQTSTRRGRKRWWTLVAGIGLVMVASGVTIWMQKRAARQSGTAISRETMAQRPSSSGKSKSPEAVNPVLAFQSVRDYCMNSGGSVSPEAYAYEPPSETTNAPPSIWSGIPMYFMHGINPTWNCRKTRPGGKYVFKREDKYILNGPQQEDAWTELAMTSSLGVGLSKNPRYNRNSPKYPDNYFELLRMNTLTCGVRFPAPVVMADQKYDTRFYYLNEAGNPSVLRWGPSTNRCFWCFEGRTILRGYAQCLQELRKILVEYTGIAREEGLNAYRKGIFQKNIPEIYIGDLEDGTREKAVVEYEFLVENQGTEPLCLINEIARTKRWTLFHRMTVEELDKDIAFFSAFEKDASVDKVYEPLYCYLTQQKILFEESEQEAARVARRFGGGGGKDVGKKMQHLAFSPIGPQTQNSRVELEATSESGGEVVFSVESGPGIIEGKFLTCTERGTVVVRARQWGNDTWKSSTVTQEVEVKAPEDSEHSPRSDREVSARSGPSPRQERESAQPMARTQQMPESEQPRSSPAHADRSKAPPPEARPELKGMVAALEAVQSNRTPAHFAKMEAEWKALPEAWKGKLQESVIGASCAMYLAKGHPERAAARKTLVDERALWTEVSEPCHDCGGKGKHRESCRVCGGAGVKRVRCSTCQGSGNCSFCHGSGQAGGRLGGHPANCPKCGGSGRCNSCPDGYVERACANCSGGMVGDVCPTCHGSGRIILQEKCEELVGKNIAKALRICRGNEKAEWEEEAFSW